MTDMIKLPKGAAVLILDDNNDLVKAYVLGRDPDHPLKYRVTTDGGWTYYQKYWWTLDVLTRCEWMPVRRSRRLLAAAMERRLADQANE